MCSTATRCTSTTTSCVEERLRTLALTIAAGASQIQRNIIGERGARPPRGSRGSDGPRSLRRPGRAARRHRVVARGARSTPTGCAAASTEPLFDELAEAGVFSLRADGFAWADCVVVFEQLGRFCVPGPLVASLLLGDGARRRQSRSRPPPKAVRGSSTSTSSTCSSSTWRRAPGASTPRRSTPSRRPWPLDPLTPVARVAVVPEATRSTSDVAVVLAGGCGAHRRVAARARRPAAPSSRSRTRKEREQFDRPIGGFQAIKHLLADMLVRTEVARAAVYAAGARSTTPTRRARPPARRRREGASRARPRSPTARRRPRCSAAWASRGRSTCTST